jgi:2-keto-4-pentenoate hydratase/2-oxohepta-3-ene-1,7-dioic acid hydratase in catechol pathway
MRFVRFYAKNIPPRYGWILGDKVGLIEGDLFDEYRRLEATLDLRSIQLLPPVEPSKIVCMGKNYAEHARELGDEIPDSPLIFFKPSSSVIGDGATIFLPPQSNQVEHEAELVVVIGKTGRWIAMEDAWQYIFGYTIGNDVTARDLQKRDGQWTRAKGFDTFCPIGPWIESELDVTDTLITCKVNGELRQMASTREMVFNIPQIITYVSSIMTLTPGDLIFTGTPSGVGPIEDTDEIDVEIEGIGHLRNKAPRTSLNPFIKT